ncbi:MAG: hypothetical protein WBK20_07960 [Spirochaetota bacterium]
MNVKFTHPPLGEEVESIAGFYVFTEERRLELNDRDVLYFVGYSVTNKSCCGVGGCMFATVAGIVNTYAAQVTEGKVISDIEPITNEETQKHIEKLLQKQGIQQVGFYMK